ncbi:5-oxoprolinase subunit PxpB [Leifsonia aquatica]|uniref:KipI family sensor histidine kinase inhibitor n=2 Tax=Leifsonia aquatica TaxID=144185 RepID=A0A7W4UZX2_LEIAQ|nr:KipI family sensor histidine kinase inhibitor [Leifsonia aquatica]
MSLRILPSGDHALLAELDGLDEVLALYRALDAERPAGVVDLVPAARTIGVVVDPDVLPLSVAQAWVERTQPVLAAPPDEHAVEILVHYDGEDLDAVAGLLGIGAREVVDLHTSSSWRVAFGGFAPGFGYLVTDHDRLRVPRRATPRTAVPAGSVGLAGEFSGVYPRSSPGGWQLIGTTDAVLWDAAADPPALLRPGALVRFREAT